MPRTLSGYDLDRVRANETEIMRLWREGKMQTQIMTELGLSCASNLRDLLERNGVSAAERRARGAEDKTKRDGSNQIRRQPKDYAILKGDEIHRCAGNRRCIACGVTFWSPHVRQIHTCNICKDTIARDGDIQTRRDNVRASRSKST